MKKLNIYYSMTFYKCNNQYYCNGAFGRFLDGLAKEYDFITVCVPVCTDANYSMLDYKVLSNNIEFQELADYKNMIGSVIYLLSSIKKLIIFSKQWENLYIRWPSPYSYIVYLLARFRNIPTTVHLVGDTRAVVKKGNKYKGVVKLAALVLAKHQEWVLKKIMKNSKVVANGNGLRRLYSSCENNVKEIRTSTFSSKEIYVRYDACEKEDIKLIYVGYLRHEKGIQYLIDAIKVLGDKISKNIYLYLVGDGEERRRLEVLVAELGMQQKVSFKGYIPLGEELFEVYRNSDIFILPSLSEGTPRVLIEAMANGLPVIATNVGGIPFTIEHSHNGLLVKPENSLEIANAIITLIEDEELRENIVNNGYEFAYKNTLETHIKELINSVEARKYVEKI